MVMGDTDSERYFALITLAIRDAGGDVRAGIKAAVNHVAEECELHSINFVLGELGHIWAFRYPDNNPLLIQQRGAGGPSGDAQLDHADTAGTLRLRSDEAAQVPVVVVASEQISDEPGWEEIASGELVHVGPDLKVDRETIITGPPPHPMVLDDHGVKSQSFA
jgi:glutamine amidotransferase